MLGSWKLGKAFGIGIYVHWTFLVLLAIVYFTARGGGGAAALFALATVISVFACVVLHEYGHALTARRFGIGTRDITLLPIGGVARLERMSDKPWEEFCIAIAGPMVNVVIVALLLTWVMVYPVVDGPLKYLEVIAQVQNGEIQELLKNYSFATLLGLFLLFVNVFLIGFNMIPAFPMDGGRVLRSVLAPLLGHLRATEVAAGLSVVFAALMGFFGIRQLLGGAFNLLPVVGLFVLFAGQQELLAVRYRAAQRDAEPLDVLPLGQPYVVHSFAPPEPNFSGFTWDRNAMLWIEWRGGRPIHASRVGAE